MSKAGKRKNLSGLIFGDSKWNITKYTDEQLLDPVYGKARRKHVRNYSISERDYANWDKDSSTDAKTQLNYDRNTKWLENARKSDREKNNPSYQEHVKDSFESFDNIAEEGAAQRKKKKTEVVGITIVALFGMYLLSLQGAVSGYCVADTNVVVGGLILILLVLLAVLIKTAYFTKEVVRYVPVVTKAKKKSKKKVKKKG